MRSNSQACTFRGRRWRSWAALGMTAALAGAVTLHPSMHEARQPAAPFMALPWPSTAAAASLAAAPRRARGLGHQLSPSYHRGQELRALVCGTRMQRRQGHLPAKKAIAFDMLLV